MKFITFACILLMAVSVPATAQDHLPGNESASNKSQEAVAIEAAKDITNSHYYNKPGSSLNDYNHDWQNCWMFAHAHVAVSYGSGVLTSIVVGAIVEGEVHRNLRKECMLLKGWRLITAPKTELDRINRLSPADQRAYRDGMVGATKVVGDITEHASFTQPSDVKLNINAPLSGPAVLWLGEHVDPMVPVVPRPGEGLILLGFRRSDKISAKEPGFIYLKRYDISRREIILCPNNCKKNGEYTTYDVLINGKNRKAEYELQIKSVSEGDYVIYGDGTFYTNVNCFGSPVFHVGSGQLIYMGDWIPYKELELSNGSWLTQLLAWAPHIEDAKNGLSRFQPSIANKIEMATFFNGATYSCPLGNIFKPDRRDLPNIARLPAPSALAVPPPAQ